MILPTYNREKEIFRAISSVLNQEFDDFEILIVDDERTNDGTEKVVESFQDERIKYFVHGTSVSEARNFGVEKSKGKYIAFIDSDDVWLPGNLGKKIRVLEENQRSFSVSYFEKINVGEKTKKVEKPFFEGESVKNSLLKGHTVPPTATVFENKVFDKIKGFDTDLSIWEDSDLIIRVINCFGEPVVLEEALVKYFIHEGSVTSKLEASELAHNLEKFIEKHMEDLEEEGFIEGRLKELEGYIERKK